MRTIDSNLYRAHVSEPESVQPALERKSARALTLQETWFQQLIAKRPEIVIGVCREAEVVDGESWQLWAREVSIDAGSIDILLVSESGQIGIVETKLAYNPEKRRTVIAQVLDYAVHLAETSLDALPELPAGIDRDEVERHLLEADYLLIIAGDQLDSGAVRIAKSLSERHLVNAWNFVLVDVALYGPPGQSVPESIDIVPNLRGVVTPEVRQVVRVEADGKVRIERVEAGAKASTRQKWTEAMYREALEDPGLSGEFKRFVRAMFEIANSHQPEIQKSFGTGKTGSLTLKIDNAGFLEIYLWGGVQIRRDKAREALGTELADRYLTNFFELFPRAAEMSLPGVAKDELDPKVEELEKLVGQVVGERLRKP